MKLLISFILIIFISLTVSCNEMRPDDEYPPVYFYDSVHKVSIWIKGGGTGIAMAVLPDSQVNNPGSQALWDKVDNR